MTPQADVARIRAKIEKLTRDSSRALGNASASRAKAVKARQAAERAKSPSMRDRKLREAQRLDEKANEMEKRRAKTEKQLASEMSKLHKAEARVAKEQTPRRPSVDQSAPPNISVPDPSTYPSFPSLHNLYQGDTVLVLGAGASKDYGFPDWLGLKDQLVGLIRAESDPNARNVFREEDASATEFSNLIDTIQSLPEGRTIDWLVEEELQQGRFFVGSVFRQGVGHILSIAEATDRKNDASGWVEELFAALSQNSGSASLRLKVITLNYERCFEHRAAEAVERTGIGHHERPDLATDPIVRVVHPHGRLGRFPGRPVVQNIVTASSSQLDSNRDLAYGEPAEDSYSYPIFPIDTLQKHGNDSLQQGYLQANNDLREAKSAILLGVSPNGLANSKLYFPRNIGVWIAGRESEFDHNVAAKAKIPQHVDYIDGYGQGVVQRLAGDP